MGRTIRAVILLAATIAAPARAQLAWPPFIPYQDSSGAGVAIYPEKECADGSAKGTICATDADCPDSVEVGRCKEAGLQGMTLEVPQHWVRKHGRIECDGLVTPVSIGAGWAPCPYLRIDNPVGNPTAYVGYSGMTTADGIPIAGGTYGLVIFSEARDCDSIVFRCEVDLPVFTP